jgi:hypothetical protein
MSDADSTAVGFLTTAVVELSLHARKLGLATME